MLFIDAANVLGIAFSNAHGGDRVFAHTRVMAEDSVSIDLNRAFSKKEAAKSLGISTRSLENAMAARTIAYEKHGRKVIFRQKDLDSYRQKHRIRSKDEPSGAGLQFPPKKIEGSSLRPTPIAPLGMAGQAALEFVQEITAEANSAGKLTCEAARKVLATVCAFSPERIDRILLDYEESCRQAFGQLGRPDLKTAMKSLDWSFAVGPWYLDFWSQIEYWKLTGKDERAGVRLTGPLDSTVSFPNRILPCLRSIPESEFCLALEVVHEHFGLRLKAERKAFEATATSPSAVSKAKSWKEHCSQNGLSAGAITPFSGDLVPLEHLLKRDPESLGKRPCSFVGPLTQAALRTILDAHFGPIEVAETLLGQVISLRNIAKLRWLRNH